MRLHQPPLPTGDIPRDPALRQALVWIAVKAEGAGPDAFGQDWPDVQRAIRWIYAHAIDPIVDRGVSIDAAAVDG